jgi:glycosyltransferase involved in cell wall biosynthesis
MKIAHVGWGHWPEHRTAGPIIYLHKLAQTQLAAGDEVTIVCASERTIPGAGPYATLTDVVDDIPYVHLCNRPAHMHDFWNPLREAHDEDAGRAFGQVFAELEPDVVHVHNFVGLSFDVIAAARRRATAVISSLHNYIPVCSRDDLFFADSERCGGPLERSCSRCLGTLVDQSEYVERHSTAVAALNSCDRVLPVSTRVKEIYAAQGVSPELMAVDHCGTPAGERLWRRLGSRRVAAAAAGREQPIGERPLRLVFFGTGLPRKGAMHLLQAVRMLRDPSRVEVNVYGGVGPADQERLGGFLASSSPAVREAIHFRGGFNQDDLDGILATADAAVLTPRWEDNGPQTVFEALSAGLPVLGSRVGGIPDFVEDGRNGLLVEESRARELAAAIERLLDEPGLLAALRAGIRPPVRMSEHARALRRFYADALGRPDEQEPPHELRCATVDDAADALSVALADRGRRGVRIDASAADDAARRELALLRGDVRIDGVAPLPPEPAGDGLPQAGWLARWPEDADALAAALAVATAYPEAVVDLEIGVEGDLAEAGEQTLRRLGEHGIAPDDVPSILLRPAAAGDELPVAELPARLAKSAAQPPGELWIGDAHDSAPLEAAAVGVSPGTAVAAIGDDLDAVPALAASGPVTVVSDSLLVRSAVAQLEADHPVVALERAGAAEALASVQAVLVDGRRAADLSLAGESGRYGAPAVAIRGAGRLTSLALEAFGLREVERDPSSGTVLATPVAPD